MKMMTSMEEVRRYAALGTYSVFPVSCEIFSDFTTPIETMRILKNVSTHCYMLESAQANDRWGRYTFLGYDPKLEITCINGELKAGNLSMKTDDPSKILRQILNDHRSPRLNYLPSFTGGLVGYFSYDYLGYSEPRVRCDADDSECFKDVDLMLFDKVIAFDNIRQKLILIVNIKLEIMETEYNRAEMELKNLVALLKHGKKSNETNGRLLGEVTPLFGKEAYCDMVDRAKKHIREGDIFQIVLSNRLSAPFDGSLLNTYRVLRTINPSPYMFYFSGTDVEVAGASPETLVKLEDGVLHTFPLAGTRPRGKTEEEDAALERELLADEKELAEHNMLVDLGRNDLRHAHRFNRSRRDPRRQGRAGRDRSGASGRNAFGRAEDPCLSADRRARKQQARYLRRRHRLYRLYRQYGYLHRHSALLQEKRQGVCQKRRRHRRRLRSRKGI